MKRRWLLLLLVPLLAAAIVASLPPPDEFAVFAQEGVAVSIDQEALGIAPWKRIYPIVQSRERAWSLPDSYSALNSRIEAFAGWSKVGSGTSEEASPGKPKILRRSNVFQSEDRGAIAIVSEDFVRQRRYLTVREPRGLPALVGRLKALGRRLGLRR